MKKFGITGVGMYVPDKILTNEEIESWGIGTSDKWILENTGIKERRIASEDETSSDLASKAALEAIEDAGLKPSEIDLIVVSTLTPDYLLPQTSSIIKQKIGANNAICFDIQAGCAGFIFGLINSINFAQTDDRIRNILITGTDVFSKVTDWSNRKVCSTIGDGAGAFILQNVNSQEGIKCSHIYHENMESIRCSYIPVYYGKIEPNSRAFNVFDGRYLYERAKEYIPQVVDNLLNKAQWGIDQIDKFFFPQTNKNFILELLDLLSIPHSKTHMVMKKYGYTFNACIPIAVNDAANNSRLSFGDKVVLIGAGAGNYCAGIALEWLKK